MGLWCRCINDDAELRHHHAPGSDSVVALIMSQTPHLYGKAARAMSLYLVDLGNAGDWARASMSKGIALASNMSVSSLGGLWKLLREQVGSSTCAVSTVDRYAALRSEDIPVRD